MKRSFRVLSLCLLTAFLATGLVLGQSATPAAPPAKTAPPAADKAPRKVPEYTIAQFLATTNWGGASFSPDGRKVLASSNKSGVFNVYAIPIEGGEPVQLTDSKVNAIFGLGYFPKDERFLYDSDQGGNERTHLYVQSPDGKVQDLTPGEKLKAEFAGWSDDDKTFFFISNERDPSAFDLYEMTLDGYARKLLFTNEGKFDIAGISPDRRYVALLKTVSTNATDVYLHDRTTGKTTLLLGQEEGVEIVNSSQDFSPDGKSLYYTTNKGAEFTYLMRYDLATGQKSEVLRADWDVVGAGFSRNGKYFQVLINNDARNELRVFEAAGMRPMSLPSLPDADITGVNFSKHGKPQMAFYAQNVAPSNLYVMDLENGRIRQLTQSLNPAIDPAHLVTGKVVRFKSYDGVEIPGILYKPHQASPETKVPALVWVHGGPGGQSRIGYSGFIQFLVNHGYAVYAINNRGSSGYGKTFFAMDDRKHGNADLDDCVASKKMLTDTGWVSPGKIGIVGGSYGGYMVLAALTFRPQEFAVGVDLYGVSNWPRTLTSIPTWWESFRLALYKEMGDPEKDAEYLKKISPLFHADKIERPLIVLQGENDPRVLKAESDEIVAAVRKKGIPVEYVLLPNEGHGFARKESQEKAYQTTLEFLDKHLKGKATAGAPSR